MEITFHGANCVALLTKTAKAVFDPVVPGIKTDVSKYDIVALTHPQEVKPAEDRLLITTPGEYESKGMSLHGILARAHMDEDDSMSAVMYRIDIPGLRIAVTGHIHPTLSAEQLEALGMVDVLIVPVGGHGYTLDAQGAAQVVRAVEPKVVIPTHYADGVVKYEVLQAELKEFLDEIGAPVVEETKYKIKDGALPEQLTVVNLARTT